MRNFLRLAATMALVTPASMFGQIPSLRLETSAEGPSSSWGQLAFGRLSPGGGAVFADLGNPRVIQVGADGRVIRTLGRQGSGPGELQAIGGLSVFPDGEVVVADIGRAVLIRWGASGKLHGEVRVRPFMLQTHRVGDELLIKSHDWRTDSLRLHRVSRNADAPQVQLASFLAPQRSGSTGRVTSPMAAWTITTAGRILVGHPDSLYVVSELSSTGTLIRQWMRPGFPTARWTEEELDRIEGFAAMAAREGGGAARPSRSGFSHRNTIPSESMGLDARGRLWVLPYVTGGMARRVDVFAAGGSLLGTLDLEGNPTGIWVEGNRLLAWGTTTDDEPAAWIYRIAG